MQGRRAEAVGWFARAAERYRESYEGAPEGSWGRLIGAIKMRVLAGDWTGAGADASWALEEGAEEAESPIGRYAAALAALVLENDPEAARLGRTLAVDPQESFPREVAQAIVGLAERDAATYAEGLALTLRSFETRDEYLEDVPVADTVLVLDALAKRRGMAVHPVSELLPASA